MTEQQKELFVSFDIAYLAKKVGFKEPCIGCFMKVDDDPDNPEMNEPPMFTMFGDYDFPNKLYSELFNDFNSEEKRYGCEIISAPMRHQLIDWFEKEHNILISYDLRDKGSVYKSTIYLPGLDHDIEYIPLTRMYDNFYDNKNDALDRAIIQAIKMVNLDQDLCREISECLILNSHIDYVESLLTRLGFSYRTVRVDDRSCIVTHDFDTRRANLEIRESYIQRIYWG